MVFSRQTFLMVESAFRSKFAQKLETCDLKGKQMHQSCSKGCHPEFCKIVRSSATGLKRCIQDRSRSMSMAFETGQPYTSICHAGIVLVCVPVMDKDKPLAGVFFGKCLWSEPDSNLKDEINKRLKGLRIDRKKLEKSINKVPVIPGRRVHKAAEFLFSTLYEITNLDPHVIKFRAKRTRQQGEISELIRSKKALAGAGQYPMDCEKQLISKVKIGDQLGAREMLNMILASIMLRDPGDLNVLKARLLELLSVLSRSAAEGGVEINLLLEKNLRYMNELVCVGNQQDMCAWINNAMNDFIELVYSTQDYRRITRIKPAVDYIESHYAEPLNLSDIAKALHLSVSRMSHVFKEQMGVTVVDYLTKVRIEHSKELLIATDKNCTEICFEVGYNNQSYFTRTFKDLAGVTPKQFREINRRKKTY